MSKFESAVYPSYSKPSQPLDLEPLQTPMRTDLTDHRRNLPRFIWYQAETNNAQPADRRTCHAVQHHAGHRCRAKIVEEDEAAQGRERLRAADEEETIQGARQGL